MKQFFLILCILLFVGKLSAQNITLPQPDKSEKMTLMEALEKRSTDRNFSEEDIDMQTLSNLLWAAWGFNRENKRTAPSSQDKQVISLYVVMKTGAYLYDAKANLLRQVNSMDVRNKMGKQNFVAIAPINIAFVADQSKNGDPMRDCGYISQNIYLYCAAKNLATVARGYYDEQEVHNALKLDSHQKVVLTQTVGKKK